jgi:hypothetical protein
MNWLKSNSTSEEAGKVGLTLREMAWNANFGHPGAGTGSTTLVLSWLLSDKEICDNLINIMFHQLAGCVEEADNIEQTVHVKTLHFMFDINKAKEKKDHEKPLTKLLHCIKAIVKFKKCVYFPHYWAAHHHWLVFRLDLEKKELSYGM